MPADFGGARGKGAEGSLVGLRVLVIDDQPDTVELMTVMLQLAGATVQALGSVREALDAVQNWRPDVVLSDLDLPGENGYDLIAEVRRSTGSHALPVIAVTAHGDDRARALAAGFTAFVPKPVDFEALVAALQIGRRPLPGLDGAPGKSSPPPELARPSDLPRQSDERPPALCERVPGGSST